MKAKLSAQTIRALRPGDKPYEVVDTEVKGFLLRVQPSGAMTYYFSYRNGEGCRRRYRIGSVEALSPVQARDQAIMLAAKVIGGQDLQAEKKRRRRAAELAKSRTLEGFLEHHYEPWATSHRKSGTATIKRIRSNFAHLMSRPLNEISLWVVEKWRSEQLKSGKARATVNRDITALKACLARAVEWEVLDANPLLKLRPLRIDQLSRVRFLSLDEERALRETLVNREERIRKKRQSANEWRLSRGRVSLPDLRRMPFADYLRPMVILTLNTGLRRGEMFQLKWSNVDLRRRELTVRGDHTKSGKTRYVPLNKEALHTLQQWKLCTDVTEYVFPNHEGRPLTNVKSSWKRVLVNAEIADFRWHDLRHHFASNLVMKGVDLNTVRELLGHSDLSMTLRYAHLSPEHKAEAVAKLCDGEENANEPSVKAVAGH